MPGKWMVAASTCLSLHAAAKGAATAGREEIILEEYLVVTVLALTMVIEQQQGEIEVWEFCCTERLLSLFIRVCIDEYIQ